MPVQTVDFLEAVSMAADLAMGLPGEHAARCCYIASRIADELGLAPHERRDVYYAGLLTDAGCTAWTSQLANHFLGDEIAARRALLFYSDFTRQLDTLNWMARYVARDASLPRRVFRMVDVSRRKDAFFREGLANTIEVAQRFARRLGMPVGVRETLGHAFERWDGKGMPAGLAGEDIPVPASAVHAAIFLEVFHQRGGPDLALELARDRRGVAFSPVVVDAFLAAAERTGFWEPLESEGVWSAVRALEPEGGTVAAPEAFAEAVTAYLADFTDMKAPHMGGHSRRVAGLAERVAEHLGLPAADVGEIRLAALVHDVGQVGIPSWVLEKPRAERSAAERDAFELHPRHTQRILLRMPGHERIAAIAAAHHEHLDGSGFPHGLAGAQNPARRTRGRRRRPLRQSHARRARSRGAGGAGCARVDAGRGRHAVRPARVRSARRRLRCPGCGGRAPRARCAAAGRPLARRPHRPRGRRAAPRGARPHPPRGRGPPRGEREHGARAPRAHLREGRGLHARRGRPLRDGARPARLADVTPAPRAPRAEARSVGRSSDSGAG